MGEKKELVLLHRFYEDIGNVTVVWNPLFDAPVEVYEKDPDYEVERIEIDYD